MNPTDEDKKLVNDIFEDLHEYFAGMDKLEDFKAYLLQDESFPDTCKQFYTKGGDNTGFELGILFTYDMWINNSPVFPVMYNPEWEKKDKS